MARSIRLLVGFLLASPALANDPAQIEFFEKKIRPVLVEHCYKCHSDQSKTPRGGLRADSREALLRGGDSGPSIVPGSPEKSKFIEAVAYKNVDLRMPPKGKLSDAAIADLTRWVQLGAPWPKEAVRTTGPKEDLDIAKRKKEHWSWQPIRVVEPPAVRDANWPRSPVDRFLLAKLEEKGLKPAAPAERRTLLRRLHFALVGLPPAPAEVEAFVADQSPSALEKVVDRLLASEQFGERWGRHWLDLVRYGETRGHEFEPIIPNAWQYRDYVIRALNADVPYNQLVTEHIAGDLLEKPRLHPKEGFNESILGTGFWLLGEEVHSPVDIRADQADRFDNRIDVMTKTFLGLTVSCARCHDHKFDAISAKDYYALFGFLESSGHRMVPFDILEHNRPIARKLHELRESARPAVRASVARQADPVGKKLTDYLLAAREVIQAGPAIEAKRVEEVAKGRQLDPALLRRWATHLQQAGKDERDLFHVPGKLAADPRGGEDGRVREVLTAQAETERKRRSDYEAALKNAEVILDYSRLAPGQWMPDGHAFGVGPVKPGDVRLSADPNRPVQVVEQAAAQADPILSGLKLAPGTENDSGALGRQVRPGRTIRTPRFLLTSGKVFYLVRGSALVHAAVGQHAVIAGPLHGQLVNSFKTGPAFQWVGFDLSNYRGLRTHLEFTATDNGDLAIAAVVQASAPPPLPPSPSPVIGQGIPTLRALAERFQTIVAGTLEEGKESEHRPAVLAWLLAHPELLGEPAEVRKALAKDLQPLLDEQNRLASQVRKDSRLALATYEGTGVDEYVFIRGSHKLQGPTVPRRFLEALTGPEPLKSVGSGRLELARQMTDPTLTPYISRVMVNRVWHHLFGRGIVGSVDNFGVLGEQPTHPELLDYLATQFVREGWSLKKLIRSLVLTSAYQMSSEPDPKAREVDPDNLLLQRMRLRRLEGEVIRDAILAISGRLDPTLFGKSIPVHLTPFQDGRGKPASGPIDGAGRRSIYLAVRRNFLSSFLLAFDTPTPFSTVGRRTSSNVPAQALILLNDPFVQQEARRWAERVTKTPGSVSDRITQMYNQAFARPPSPAELQACQEFLAQQGRQMGKPAEDLTIWTDLAHTLFNVKEFIFLE